MDTAPLIVKKKEEMSNPVDLSSLPEEERQQLQKLQERFKEHQQQQQKQQQQQQQVPNHPSQSYAPSQIQNQPPYDQQYQPYYGYHPYQAPPVQSSLHHPPFPPDHQHYYQDHRLQPQQQQHYYHTEHTNAYHEHHMQQLEPHPQQLPPQIVPIPHPSAHLVNLHPQPQPQILPPPAGQIQVHHQHNVYYPQNGRSDGDQQQSGPLNPAAAAAVSALSQLMQFAGTMGDAERALTMIGLQASGIAGYGPSIGQPLHQDSFLPLAGQSMYMGGDIRGGGSSFPHNPEGKIRQRIGKGKIGPKLPYLPSSMPETTGTAANKLQVPAAWCELCKVECTSLEILKQHKNGKKHMKNLEKNGTSSSLVVQNNQNITSSTPVIIDSNAQPQANVENSNNIVAGQKRESNHKTKAAGGGGGGAKRAKLYDMQNRAFENPKPKVVVPLLCSLCNIKCDTQEVLNKHLSGKKHISKLRRYEPQPHQTGIQSLYHLNAPFGVPPHHPLHFPQVHHQPQSYYPPLLPAAAALHGIVPFVEGNHHNQ